MFAPEENISNKLNGVKSKNETIAESCPKGLREKQGYHNCLDGIPDHLNPFHVRGIKDSRHDDIFDEWVK